MLSILTVSLTLVYLAVLACHIFELPMYKIIKAPTVFLVSLVVAPSLSLTTIIVFALIGVFRGYKDKDLEEAPVSTVVRTATGQDV